MARMDTASVGDLDFVGRQPYIQKFWELKSEHIQSGKQNHCALMYYGVGGIGKSRLKKEIINDIEKYHLQNDFAVHINLESGNLLATPPAILYGLKEEISKVEPSASFPRFEYAYLIYYTKIHPLVEVKQDNRTSRHHLDTITPVVQAFIQDKLISASVGVVSKLIQKAPGPVQKWWREFQYPELLVLNQREPYQIAEQLPQLFATDLNDYLDKNSSKHPVFFFDTLENLIGKERDEDHLLHHDKWLRQLVYELPRVLWVFFGREQLRWATLHKSKHWENDLHQYKVNEFTEEDFITLMDNCHIGDERIREKIATASGRHPFYVTLSVSTYRRIARTRVPTADDFGDSRPEIYKCFVRHLTKEESDTFKILSCVQYWDEPLFDTLLSKFNPRFQGLDSFEQVSSFSFVTENESGDNYTLHQLMQRHLYDDLCEKLPNRVDQIHRFCFDYLSDQLSEIEEVEAKKELLLRINYHSLKIHSTVQVYQQTLEQIKASALDPSIHFSFLFQLLLPVSEKLILLENAEDLLTLAACYSYLGNLLDHGGKYEDAEQFSRRSLRIRESILGIHPYTQESHNNLGGALLKQKRYGYAEPMLRNALKTFVDIETEESRWATATVRSNLALCLQKQNDPEKHEEAYVLHTRVLHDRKQIFGEYHEYVAIAYANVGGFLRDRGKSRMAEDMHRKALDVILFPGVLERPECHPLTAQCYHNLAMAIISQSNVSEAKRAEAKDLSEQAFTISREMLGEHHPTTALIRDRMKLHES